MLVEPAERAGVPLLATGAARPATSSAPSPPGSRSGSRPRRTLHGDLVEVHGLGVADPRQERHRQERGGARPGRARPPSGRRRRRAACGASRRRVLRGRAAQLLTHHMEIRGLGIIDVEELFGTLATLDERQIDLVVELIDWTRRRRPARARRGALHAPRRRAAAGAHPRPAGPQHGAAHRGRGAQPAAAAARPPQRARVRGARRPSARAGARRGRAVSERAARGRRHRAVGVGQEHRAPRARGPRLLLHRQPAGRAACRGSSSCARARARTSAASRSASTCASGASSTTSRASSRSCARAGVALEVLYLEASDDVLVRRFSETRRPHPAAEGGDGRRRHPARARGAARAARAGRPHHRHERAHRAPAARRAARPGRAAADGGHA